MSQLNVEEFIFLPMPFTYRFTTRNGGVYEQKAYSYLFENNHLTFLCEVQRTLSNGEPTFYTTGFFSVNDVVTVELLNPHFSGSLKTISEPDNEPPVPTQQPIIIQNVLPSAPNVENNNTQVAPTSNATQDENATDETASNDEAITTATTEKTTQKISKPKIDAATLQSMIKSKQQEDYDDEIDMSRSGSLNDDELVPPQQNIDDEMPADDNSSSIDESDAEAEKWAHSKVGIDPKQEQYEFFTQGLAVFVKSNLDKPRPLGFDLNNFSSYLESQGFNRAGVSIKDLSEWVCDFIMKSDMPPQIWLSERDERIFDKIAASVLVPLANRCFNNPVVLQQELSNSNDTNIRSQITNNMSAFTTFKIAAYIKHKKELFNL